MNYWKAEFTKAGELALASGTLLVLGWVLFLIGKGIWGVAIAPEKFDVPDMVAGGILVAFLVTYFYGYYRRNKACACIVAFVLNFVALCGMLAMFTSGSPGDGPPSFDDVASPMYIASLIWILGLLLLWFRFSRTILSPVVYVLVGAAPAAFLAFMAWMTSLASG